MFYYLRELHRNNSTGLSKAEPEEGNTLALAMDSMILSRDETTGSNVKLLSGTYHTENYTLHIKGDLAAEGVKTINVTGGML